MHLEDNMCGSIGLHWRRGFTGGGLMNDGVGAGGCGVVDMNI